MLAPLALVSSGPQAASSNVMHVLKRCVAWPRGIRLLAAGTAAIVLAFVIAWALFVPAADWLAHHDVGSARGPLLLTARDAARGRLLTFFAGLFAVGALIFTALNFNLLRHGQVTDRYTRAIEQLGSGKLDVCIGGIYALERVAHDSPRDHPPVMEVLTTFVREHSREQWPPGVSDDARTTRPDIQAALYVIGRREARHDRRYIYLGGANLTEATLVDANLARANLASANLTRANLPGADLTGATLSGVNLTGANLTRRYFPSANLSCANLSRANLTGADLTGVDPELR